ncbi:uncharacterized protein PAC_19309 [Phialocephala subalpina]|uniref:Uncharacterized protein n=1 Tax=Phialocephala subalpina TaxID=576137 RepID=A0A1L7XWQ4_9HELO|nr:uncharacterized protein PAC_19309 [Phialocephala subalpina]
MATPHMYPNKQDVTTASTEVPASDTASQKEGFFPWLEDEVHQNLTVKVLKRFPVLGAVGLVGSALTVLLSWLTLFFFNGHKVIEGHLPKPAAWLSIILSLNGILVHMAVAQGIAVTWWYRASREQATVADLHNVWATGSSVVSAITSWRVFNYVALATVFVATLPINGILLQNSITTELNYRNYTPAVTKFGIADKLPAGFSASLNPDGTVGMYQSAWQTEIPYVIAKVDGVFKSFNENTTCKGYCAAKLNGVGFEATCTNYTIPYSLPLDSETVNTTADSTMFSVEIGWNVSSPYTIYLNTLFKPTPDCSGEYMVRNCSLQMAKVPYQTQVEFNATGDGDNWWSLTEEINGAHHYNTYYPSEPTEVYTDIPVETNATTFGGIASALATYYDSSIVLHPDGNGTSLKVNGLYAQQIQPSYASYNDDGTPVALPNKCNTSFSLFGGYYFDPTDFMLDSIRTTLFYTSIHAADQDQVSVQEISRSVENVGVNEYHVLWRFWGASVAVTLSIVLFILPTYYGFWTLARKTTLSPFETARAFHAPVLKDAANDLDTPALLREVGGKKLHIDFAAGSSAGSPVEEKSG